MAVRRRSCMGGVGATSNDRRAEFHKQPCRSRALPGYFNPKNPGCASLTSASLRCWPSSCCQSLSLRSQVGKRQSRLAEDVRRLASLRTAWLAPSRTRASPPRGTRPESRSPCAGCLRLRLGLSSPRRLPVACCGWPSGASRKPTPSPLLRASCRPRGGLLRPRRWCRSCPSSSRALDGSSAPRRSCPPLYWLSRQRWASSPQPWRR